MAKIYSKSTQITNFCILKINSEKYIRMTEPLGIKKLLVIALQRKRQAINSQLKTQIIQMMSKTKARRKQNNLRDKVNVQKRGKL